MRGGGGQRAVSLNNKELSLKRKKDMRQVSGETGRDDGKMDWVTEGDDSKQVEPRSCEVVLKMTHPDTLPPCFFFFCYFPLLHAFYSTFWLSYTVLICFFLLTFLLSASEWCFVLQPGEIKQFAQVRCQEIKYSKFCWKQIYSEYVIAFV